MLPADFRPPQLPAQIPLAARPLRAEVDEPLLNVFQLAVHLADPLDEAVELRCGLGELLSRLIQLLLDDAAVGGHEVGVLGGLPLESVMIGLALLYLGKKLSEAGEEGGGLVQGEPSRRPDAQARLG